VIKEIASTAAYSRSSALRAVLAINDKSASLRMLVFSHFDVEHLAPYEKKRAAGFCFVRAGTELSTVPCLDSCVVRVLSPSPVRLRMRCQRVLSDTGRAIHSSRHPSE
jgi:hypothetical protein